jgi:hypothetical protein
MQLLPYLDKSEKSNIWQGGVKKAVSVQKRGLLT